MDLGAATSGASKQVNKYESRRDEFNNVNLRIIHKINLFVNMFLVPLSDFMEKRDVVI